MIKIEIDASKWIPESVTAEKYVRGKPVTCHCVLGHIAKTLGVLAPYMVTDGAILAIRAKMPYNPDIENVLRAMVKVNDTGKMGLVETQKELTRLGADIGLAISFDKNPHEEMRYRKGLFL